MSGGPDEGEVQPEALVDDEVGPSASASLRRKDPLVGTTLDGRYEVEKLIARGGMGRIYQARQSALGRTIALKVMDLGYSEDLDPDFQKRFVLEASTCAQLSHPNTIRIFDYGTDGDICYIAMELIDGVTLLQAIHDQAPFPAARVLHIARQICSSLSEAHGKGIIHRDLKPSNVLLTTHGDQADFAKVLDFGLVKLLRDDAPEITRSGLFLGSPNYMSPEQIRSSNVDQRSDLYSLGVILFMAITGRAPFKRNNSINVLLAQLEEQPPHILDVVPTTDATAALQWIIMNCLEKEADRRFATVDEMGRALKACQKELRGELDGPLLLRLDRGQVIASTVPPGIDPVVAHGLRPAAPGPRSEIATVETGSLAGGGRMGYTPSLGSQAWRPSGPSGTFSLGPGAAGELPARPTRSPPRRDAAIGAPTVEHPGPPAPAFDDEPPTPPPARSPSGPSLVGRSPGGRSERSAARAVRGEDASGARESTSAARRRRRPTKPSFWQSRGAMIALVLLGGAVVASVLAMLARTPPTAEIEPTAGPASPLDAVAAPPVVLSSEPSGAGVYRDGAFLGTTPLSLEVPTGSRWRVMLTAPGRIEQEIAVPAGSAALHVALALPSSAPERGAAGTDIAGSAPTTRLASPLPSPGPDGSPSVASGAASDPTSAPTPEPPTESPTPNGKLRVQDVRDPWDD